ncbi:probable galactoside 2-alpha-L-fucosyltransferase [Coccomyxa sp. Obi]|nr:probable galactoside 2-alpha-L-fucosyltransferase [Coccomyxa sp. Obi]
MVRMSRFYLGLVVVGLVAGPFRAISTGWPSADQSSQERYQSSDAAVAKVEALQRLRELERHARLQPLEELVNSYRARHEACVNVGSGLPGKYVKVTGGVSVGVRNGLPAVLTGLLLALITDRCLFVDFAFYEDLFQPDLDFSWNHHVERLLAQGHDPNKPPNEPRRLPGTGTGPVSEVAEVWMLQNLTDLSQGHYGIEVKNDCDCVEWTPALLQSNPFHQDFIDLYFPTREIFAALAPFMLKVTPQVENRTAAFKQDNFKLFTIGIQITRHRCDAWPDEIIDRKELPCALRPSIESYCAVARSIQLSHGLNDNDVRFFLVADDPDVYDQVAEILGRERVIFTDNGIPRMQKADHIQYAPNANTAQLETNLMDLALLSRCDDLVMTVTSSTGYIAAAWGGIAPVHMLYGKHQSAQNPYWFRAINSEPCYWQAKDMMRALDTEGLERFRSNPFWMQYSQCHHAVRLPASAKSW